MSSTFAAERSVQWLCLRAKTAKTSVQNTQRVAYAVAICCRRRRCCCRCGCCRCCCCCCCCCCCVAKKAVSTICLTNSVVHCNMVIAKSLQTRNCPPGHEHKAGWQGGLTRKCVRSLKTCSVLSGIEGKHLLAELDMLLCEAFQARPILEPDRNTPEFEREQRVSPA